MNDVTLHDCVSGLFAFLSALFLGQTIVRNFVPVTPPWGFLGACVIPSVLDQMVFSNVGPPLPGADSCLLWDFPAYSGSNESTSCVEGLDGWMN